MEQPIVQTSFWNTIIFGNAVHDYFFMIATLFALLIVLRFAEHSLLNRLRVTAKKTETDLEDMFITVIESLRPSFYFFISVYLSSKMITLAPTPEKIIMSVLVLWVVYQIITTIEIVMEYALSKRMDEKDGDTKTTMGIIRFVINLVIWSIGIILALSNLGINVTSLLAGLGIGGVAIALASQNILGDLFSSFAIHFDKPFVIGDFITIGTDSGTIEKIGLKTTRLRGLQGEQLIISNKELTSVRIQNFKRMEERRVNFTIGVEHSTDGKKLRLIPEWVKEIIETEPQAHFDRSHFKKINDSSLDFETVYYVLSNEYIDYLNVQQNINLAIYEKLAKEKVFIAFPTQTIYTRKG